MALTWVWVGMVCMALVYGAATGQSAAVGAAAAQGVQQAVSFCLTVGGMICLWSGVMEVMRRSGIAAEQVCAHVHAQRVERLCIVRRAGDGARDPGRRRQ